MPDLNELEVGRSVFELIEFTLTRYRADGSQITGRYGVNVAKVREVVRIPEINPLSSRIPGVAGVFELRGIPIPAINLAQVLGDDHGSYNSNDREKRIIVTEFSSKRAGFVVDSTERIRRIAWDQVLPPASENEACINGMTLVEDNQFLFILDLERILLDLESRTGMGSAHSYGAHIQRGAGAAPTPHQLTVSSAPYAGRLLVVDDSSLIRNALKPFLMSKGYEVHEAVDGLNAKNMILDMLSKGKLPDLVISDVEMPQMDGLTFTKWVRDFEDLRVSKLPVILNTSLSGQANQAASEEVGATAYVVKNDMRTLMDLVQETLAATTIQSAS
ncbi:MAG: chemotaxis protein [Oligoflexales bacterium]